MRLRAFHTSEVNSPYRHAKSHMSVRLGRVRKPESRRYPVPRILLFFIALVILAPCLSCTYNKNQIEVEIFDLINQQRAEHNLPPLRNLKELDELALFHSRNMLKHDFFAHRDQDGREVADRMDELYPALIYSSIGENIAKQSGAFDANVAQTFVQGWMNSPGHRANILSEDYTHAGIGIAFDNQVIYATQNFAKPIVRLLTTIPHRVRESAAFTLDLQYLYDIRRSAFNAYLIYPDPEKPFFISENVFVKGFEPVQVEWKEGNTFRVTLNFNAGAGTYRLSFGDSKSFSQTGYFISVN